MSVNASEQTQVPADVLLLVSLKNRSVRLTNKQNKKWQSQEPCELDILKANIAFKCLKPTQPCYSSAMERG